MSSLFHVLLRRHRPLLRPLSTIARRGIRPNPSLRSPSVDIGARARRLQARRLWSYGITFSCVAGLIVAGLANFQDSLVFYITPSEALERFASDPSGSIFRLGGLVLEGSVSHPSDLDGAMEFVVTDLISDILVRYDGGSVPDLFREGHSAVIQGFFKKLEDGDVALEGKRKVTEKARGAGCYFEAKEVLAKHDEKYVPKEIGEALERNRKKIKAEAAAAEREKQIHQSSE